jgi:hypothetical protein
MPDPSFQPGFRLSATDVVILIIGTGAAAYVFTIDRWFGVAIAFIVLHFFFFCNILRMSRLLELIWAGAFAGLAFATFAFGLPWPGVFGIATGLTALFAGLHAKHPSYHGVGWKKLNPRLPEWWHAARSDQNP